MSDFVGTNASTCAGIARTMAATMTCFIMDMLISRKLWYSVTESSGPFSLGDIILDIPCDGA